MENSGKERCCISFHLYCMYLGGERGVVRVQTVTVVYVTAINSRLHKLVCAVVMSSKAYRTYSFKVSLFLSLHPYARAITMWCMMHCKHGTALDEHACICTCTCTSNSGDLNDTCSIGHINKLVHAQIDSYLGTQDHALPGL